MGANPRIQTAEVGKKIIINKNQYIVLDIYLSSNTFKLE